MKNTPLYLLLAGVASTGWANVSIDVYNRHFFEPSTLPAKQQNYFSAELHADWVWTWDEADLVIEPVVSVAEDDALNYIDFQQLLFTYRMASSEVFAGVGMVFWGVTESYHLTDIVNQVNLVADLAREKKLGQPMVGYRRYLGDHTLELYWLPYFREQVLAEKNSRPWRSRPISGDPEYERSGGQWAQDVALRLSGFYESVDYGVSYFYGTERNPFLIINPSRTEFTETYVKTNKLAVDSQLTLGSTLLKSEMIYSSPDTQGDEFAMVAGIEQGIYGIVDTQLDASLFIEGLYSNNQQGVALPYKQHIMTGLRLDLNNEGGSNIMFSIINDKDDRDRTYYVNAQHRLKENISAEVDVWYFDIRKQSSNLPYLKEEGYIQIGLEFYF